jgi:hypothetical protein
MCYLKMSRCRCMLWSISWMPLCETSPETLDHITLQCPYATAVWSGTISRLQLPSIVPLGAARLKLGSGGLWRSGDSLRRTGKRLTPWSCLSCGDARVFNRVATTAHVTLRLLLDEWHAWMLCRHGLMWEVEARVRGCVGTVTQSGGRRWCARLSPWFGLVIGLSAILLSLRASPAVGGPRAKIRRYFLPD